MPFMSTRRANPKRRIMADWRDAYFAAVLETDAQQAALKMLSARNAMQQRLLELQTASSGSDEEFRDLHSALTYLSILLAYLEESASAERLPAIA